ncbi:helix-turn-helix transcriptional regulator [Marinomonas algicola]|uniref:helix-turn-helix transcriptional regulator n=1 Tax=Marinomonas algicola TaxID=2773454 RepID=UPI00174AFB39|nr:helix-turn-helix transcriptional regulator [Marinomonas algicola]
MTDSGSRSFLFIHSRLSYSFSSREKDERCKVKWSQEELGRLLGVSRQAINAIEREKHDPSLQLAFTISKVFNLPIEAIFMPTNLEPK